MRQKGPNHFIPHALVASLVPHVHPCRFLSGRITFLPSKPQEYVRNGVQLPLIYKRIYLHRIVGRADSPYSFLYPLNPP